VTRKAAVQFSSTKNKNLGINVARKLRTARDLASSETIATQRSPMMNALLVDGELGLKIHLLQQQLGTMAVLLTNRVSPMTRGI
jgi:uncharacterized membrane protein